MISYFSKNEKDNLQFCESFKELKVARNLKAANITKASSPNNNQNLSALAIFLLLVFPCFSRNDTLSLPKL